MALPSFSSFSSFSAVRVLPVLVRLVPYAIRENPYHLSNYQYPFLAFLGISYFFALGSIPLLLRLGMYTALALACTLPLTHHFFVAALPIFAWLLTFFGCKYL